MADDPTLRERFFRDGKLDDCPVYDLHGHMGPLQGACLPRCTPEAMVAAMDRAGVRLTVFCHHDALLVAGIGNAVNLAEARRFPDRLRAYCGINPNHADQVARDVEQFDANRDVYVGFKLLADYHKIPITDPRAAPAWEKANADRLPVLLHTWGGSSYDGPQRVRECAQRYPDAQILMGHSCHGAWREAAQLAKEFANVYLELTAVLDDRGAVDLFVRQAGSRKIIFGTDTPWFNHHYYIGALLGAEMTDDRDRGLILENTSRHLAHQWIDDGLGIRSNHFVLPEAQTWIARAPDANTLRRYQRACQLIQPRQGEATSELFAQVSRDHSAGPDSICSDNSGHFWMTLSAFTHAIRREHTDTLTVTWVCNGHTRNACYFPMHLAVTANAADLVSGQHNAPSWRTYAEHGCGDHLSIRQDPFESAARTRTAAAERQAIGLLHDGKPEDARILLTETDHTLADQARADVIG